MDEGTGSIERIVVVDVVGSSDCVSGTDAERLYERIVEAMEAGRRVELSFAGVERMPTCFLNPAIGRLYGTYGAEGVRRRMVPPVHALPWHLANLRAVVERAGSYFAQRDETTTAAPTP